MSKRITLADIARKTELSVATVSFVLSNRPGSRISEATAQRVRRAAEELGYSPDPNAQGLRTGKTGTIGFVSDEVTLTRYASGMIRGILDVGDANDRAVIMAERTARLSYIERAIDVMLARRVEGLIFGLMSARQIDLPPIPPGVPGIIVNGVAPGWPGVLPDEHAAGLAAVEHLVHQGHRRIGFIGRATRHRDPYFSVTIGRRMDGIDEGMTAAGLEFAHEVHSDDWEPEVGYAGAREILATTDVTAILVANDRVALGAYQAAQACALSIPEDLSIMSFDDEQLATYLRPQVTTMRLPYLEMGRLAMGLLVDRIDGRRGDGLPDPPGEILVPMPLISRGSVAPSR